MPPKRGLRNRSNEAAANTDAVNNTQNNINASGGAGDPEEEGERPSHEDEDDEEQSYGDNNSLQEQILELTRRTEELQDALDTSKTQRPATNVVMSHNIEPCTRLKNFSAFYQSLIAQAGVEWTTELLFPLFTKQAKQEISRALKQRPHLLKQYGVQYVPMRELDPASIPLDTLYKLMLAVNADVNATGGQKERSQNFFVELKNIDYQLEGTPASLEIFYAKLDKIQVNYGIVVSLYICLLQYNSESSA